MDGKHHIHLSGNPNAISARSVHSSRPVRVIQMAESGNGAAFGKNEKLRAAGRSEKGTDDLDNASQSILELLGGIQERLEQIDAARSQSLGELQQLAVRLSVVVAETVVRHELATDTGRIESLVQLALEQLPPDDSIRIFACEDDLAKLEAVVNEKTPAIRPTIQVDSKLRPGDFRIEGGTYGLESLVTDQLQTIQERLLESLEDAQTERRQAAGDHSGLGRFPNRRQGT